MRPRLSQLHQSGATAGQVPVWDDTAGLWAPGTPSGGGYTDEQVRDVIGAALVAGTGITVTVNDAGDTITIAVDTAAEIERVVDAVAAALVAGTNTTIVYDDALGTITISSSGGSSSSSLAVQDEGVTVASGVTQIDFQGAGVTAAAGTGEVVVTIPGGSAGLTQSYLGTNAVGATWENTSNRMVYLKKITIPSGGRLLTNVEAHLRNNTSGSNVNGAGFGLYADNAGAPREFLGVGGFPVLDSQILQTAAGVNGLGRWLGGAFGRWLDAGDYWVALYAVDSTGLDVAVTTTGGTDRTYTAGGGWQTDAGYTAVTTTVKNYSIRASILG